MAAGRSAALRVLAETPAALAGFLVVGLFVAWGASEGGYPVTHWIPGALLVLGLLAVVALGRGRIEVPRGPARWALFLMAAFSAWSFLSIAWADVRGDAWDGANRTLLYLTIYAVFACWAWRPRPAVALLGLFALATAVVGVVVLIGMTLSSGPESYFVARRFAEPVGYANANAALWLGAFWPAVFLASRRETPWPLRGALLAAAGLLMELGFMCQSRGAVIAIPVVVVLYVIAVPDRARGLAVLLAVGAATLAALDPILDVTTAATEGSGLSAALDRAGRAMGLSLIPLACVGAAWGYVDSRARLSPSKVKTLRIVTVTTAAVAALLTVAIAAAAVGNPATWASDRWDEFTRERQTGSAGSRFSGGLGSNRYDFWRVGVRAFADDPLIGNGADNFAVDYLRERRSEEEPLYPHSLEVRVLSQTGVIGTTLFAAFLALASAAALGARRGRDPLVRAAAGVCIVAFAYWAVHGSGDWLWEFPALAGPAFAWLGIASALRPDGEAHRPTGSFPGRIAHGRPVGLLATALVIAAAASYVLPWMAARQVDKAARTWGANPDAAFDRLQSARGLNFLSAQPDLVAGAIANRLRDRRRARAAFSRALERNPSDWYARLELAALDFLEGRAASAMRRLDEARRLNPREPILASAAARVRRGRPLSPDVIERELLGRVR